MPSRSQVIRLIAGGASAVLVCASSEAAKPEVDPGEVVGGVALRAPVSHHAEEARAWPIVATGVGGEIVRFHVERPEASDSPGVMIDRFGGVEPGYVLGSVVMLRLVEGAAPPEWFLEAVGSVVRPYEPEHPCGPVLREDDPSRLILRGDAGSVRRAAELAVLLRDEASVQWVEQAVGAPTSPDSYPDEPMQSLQHWIGRRAYEPGVWRAQCDFAGAWTLSRFGSAEPLLGKGTRVGICEGGLQASAYHDDLASNYAAFPAFPPIPLRSLAGYEEHSTATAGIVGAASNGLGIGGGAPETRWGQMPFNDAAELGIAYAWDREHLDVVNNSWSYRLYLDQVNRTEEWPLVFPWTWAFLEGYTMYVEEGRCEAGGIPVVSAGNAGARGLFGDPLWEDWDSVNSNNNAMKADRRSIVVGAVFSDNSTVPYTSPGTNVLISANSGIHFLDGPFETVLTTGWRRDQNGDVVFDSQGRPVADWIDDFSGTSASAPQVTAGVALMLQMNPALTLKDVQHIIVATADRSGLYRSTMTNAAGYEHSRYGGFGRFNAYDAVRTARHWPGVGDERLARFPSSRPILDLPTPVLIGAEPHTFGFHIPEAFDMDHVGVVLRVRSTDANIAALHAGIRVELISPSGTISRIGGGFLPLTGGLDLWYDEVHNIDVPDELLYEFTTVQFWGEQSDGHWRLRITDLSLGPGVPPRCQIEGIGVRVYGVDAIPDAPCDFDLVDAFGLPFPDGVIDATDLQAWVDANSALGRGADRADERELATPDGVIDSSDLRLYERAVDEWLGTGSVPCSFPD